MYSVVSASPPPLLAASRVIAGRSARGLPQRVGAKGYNKNKNYSGPGQIRNKTGREVREYRASRAPSPRKEPQDLSIVRAKAPED